MKIQILILVALSISTSVYSYAQVGVFKHGHKDAKKHAKKKQRPNTEHAEEEISSNNKNHPAPNDIKVNNTALDGEIKQPLENTNHRPEGRAADDEHTTPKAHKAD